MRVGFGSDSGVGLRIPGVAEHLELALMVEAGLTPMQAITTATSNSAALLKLDDRGVLASGKLADLVVLEGDHLSQGLSPRLAAQSATRAVGILMPLWSRRQIKVARRSPV